MNNLKNLIVQEARPLPVIILADVSGSMHSDNNITILNNSIREMIDSLKDEDGLRAEIFFSVITFGGAGAKIHLELTKTNNIQWKNLQAGGHTPMGETFALVKQIIENKNIIPSRSYAPTLVLLSDGAPTDEWKMPLNDLLTSPRASKTFNIAMSIGTGNENSEVLKEFLKNTELEVFKANQARDIKNFFGFVTMSVSQRVQSVNPDQPKTISFNDLDDDLDSLDF